LTDLALQAGLLPRVVEEPVYHITTEAALEKAMETGELTAESLETEGFIHCSEAWQLPGVIDRFYKGAEGLKVVKIKPSKLTSKLIYEKATDVEDWFPHVYGSIQAGAITEVDNMVTS
jgi:uncharacterized protein (DUF952 family)